MPSGANISAASVRVSRAFPSSSARNHPVAANPLSADPVGCVHIPLPLLSLSDTLLELAEDQGVGQYVAATFVRAE